MSLFHIHDLDFAIDEIANDLTSRLERPRYRQVIEADLVSPKKGSQAHSQELDADRIADGKPPYAYRLASTIFVHSLTQGVASGVDPAELAESVLCPGDEPSYLKRVLGELEDRCWFIEFDGSNYRFKTEVGLNKLIADEAQAIPVTKAKQELEDRIRSVWKKSSLHPVYFPSEAAEVDDDAGDPKLVVLHFDAATAKEIDEGQIAPELVLRLFDHAGSMEGYRSYKNNVVFLVADADHVEHLVDQMRKYLAVNRIVGDSGRMAEFNKDQKEKLTAARNAAELDVRVAITRAYRFLYYPTEDAPRSAGTSPSHRSAQDQGESRRTSRRCPEGSERSREDPHERRPVEGLSLAQGQGVALQPDPRQHRGDPKGVCPSDQPAPPPRHHPTKEDDQEWHREPGLGVLRGRGAASLRGEFAPARDQVQRRHRAIRGRGGQEPEHQIKGEEKRDAECPVCHEMPCKCGEEIEDEKPQTRLHAEGAPSQAFQRLSDLCAESTIARLRVLFVKLDGSGATGARELKSIGLAIPQMGKGT